MLQRLLKLQPLPVLVGALGALPPLAIWVARDGHAITVLYRDPKRLVLNLVGWLTVCVLVLAFARLGRPVDVRRLASSWQARWLVAVLLWMTISLLWSWIPMRAVVELSQWWLLILLTLLLVVLAPRWGLERALRSGILVGAGVLTGVGLIQAAGLLPWLGVAEPQHGVLHPSLMGHKNSAAHAVAGQWFLLLGAFWKGHRSRRKATAVFLAVLAAAEFAYVVSLSSRAALAGLGLGCGALMLAWLSQRRCDGDSGRADAASRWVLTALGGLCLVAPLIVVWGLNQVEGTNDTVEAKLSRVDLSSADRLAFWRNSVNMAVEQPLGVGLGNWEVAYPVFRAVHRYRGFSSERRVREAHSEPLQMLAEIGWLGFGLLVALVLSVLWCAACSGSSQSSLRKRPGRAILTAQGLCLLAIAAVDFPLQHEANRALLFWWIALVLIRARAEPPSARQRAGFTAPRRVVVAVTILVAAGQGFFHLNLFRAGVEAARFDASVATVRAGPGPTPLEFADLNRALDIGQAALLLPLANAHPEIDRRWLTLGEVCQRLGLDACLETAARQALRNAPFEPLAMRQLAKSLERSQPELADRWLSLAWFVELEAVSGIPDRFDPLVRYTRGRPQVVFD